MTDSHIPEEPDSETKDDAYKLAMLAAQLKRLKNGDLDLNAAYRAWKDSIDYVQTQYQGKSTPGLVFNRLDFKIYPLKEGLKKMEIQFENWKNTFRKKFRRWGMEKEEIDNNLAFWEKCGIPDFHVEQFRNEKATPVPDSDDQEADLSD